MEQSLPFVGLLFATLFLGHSLSQTPLEQLGKRPMGRELWGWLGQFLLDNSGGGGRGSKGSGVWGYDSSLGAWSPPIRLLIHLSLCGILNGAFGKLSVLLYALWCYYNHHLRPNVSHPGGPRDHKIQRMPQFQDKDVVLEDADIKIWRPVVASDAHADTELKFHGVKEGAILSGEPVGRQMWTHLPKSTNEQNKNERVDETLVKQLAAGGREPATFNAAKNPNSGDMLFRSYMIRNYLASGNKAPDLKSRPKTAQEAARKGAHFYSMLQTEDGHWAGDYGGPHFLMPGMIIVWYVMGKPPLMLNDEQTKLMRHYITVHQQRDGGWGTHIESPSTMFGTTLMYVALRLLGVDKDDPRCEKGRTFIRNEGGAVMTASWCKFYLCVLGCMEWDGHNSVPPEMFLLPNWTPFHPGRLWCHCRMVYLPMGFLYGSRFVYNKAATDPVVQSLRNELYVEDYDSIHWIKTRHLVADMDNYSPIPLVMRVLQNMLARYETWSFLQPFKNMVRKAGLAFSLDYMIAEDLQTNYINIGPVNKVLNMLSSYHASGNNAEDPSVIRHFMRVQDYLWVAEDGMKMQGYNGSQCWDTSFAIQAYWEAGLLDEFPDVTRKAWSFLERTQILSTETSQASAAYDYESNENRDKYYRHVSQGGWPFSSSAHGWPISDCTGEGLKASLCVLHHSATIKSDLSEKKAVPITVTRLENAINVCLTLQNEDGGWATYENNRGFGWYEQLNPSEVFGDIMIDYSYVECSMATLTALADFHEHYPQHRRKEIMHAIAKGKEFFKSIQRPDGSWYGSWACCFCYACWFGIEGLVKAGESKSCPEIKKCCEFLIAHQRENGGWGEDFTSCYDKDYAKNGMDAYGDDGSGVVNTAWALLALAAAECDDLEAIKRGVEYLMKRQLASGDWPQEGISGVFNRACGITYTAYRNVFPIWALGRCAATYGESFNLSLNASEQVETNVLCILPRSALILGLGATENCRTVFSHFDRETARSSNKGSPTLKVCIASCKSRIPNSQ